MVDNPQTAGPGMLERIVSAVRTVVFFAFSAVYVPLIVVVALIDRRRYYPWARIWAHAGLAIFGIHVEASGVENLEDGRDYVLLANHRSHFDPFAIVAALGERETRWVAKRELERIPVFGYGMRRTGQIMIDRQNHDQAVQALRENLGTRGISVVFFGEGRRAPTPAVLPFKKGAAAFAIASGFPLVPVAVGGSHRVLPKYALLTRPGTIRVKIGKPIPVDGLTRADHGRLTERARREVVDMLREIDPDTTDATAGGGDV